MYHMEAEKQMINKVIYSKNKIIEIDIKASDEESLKCLKELEKTGFYNKKKKFRYFFMYIKLEEDKESTLVFIKEDTEEKLIELLVKGKIFYLGSSKENFKLLTDKLKNVTKSTSKINIKHVRGLKYRKILIMVLIMSLLWSSFVYFINIDAFSFSNLNKISLLALYITGILALQDAIDVMSKYYSKPGPIAVTKVLVAFEWIYFVMIIANLFFPQKVEGGELYLTFVPILFTFGVLGLKFENIKKLIIQ